jgi:hypothetical protein
VGLDKNDCSVAWWQKKTARLAGGFRISGCLHVLSTLSIRQRSEMPEKIKIKLRGGHGGKGLNGSCVKNGDCLYNPRNDGLASAVR